MICCLSEFVFPLLLSPTELCVGGGPVQRAQREEERELGSHAARLEFEAQQNQEIVDESAKPNNQRAANKLYIMDTN